MYQALGAGAVDVIRQNDAISTAAAIGPSWVQPECSGRSSPQSCTTRLPSR